MKKLYSLITGVVLVLVTPFALAMDTEQGGIESSTSSSAFWYAGTSGVSSD